MSSVLVVGSVALDTIETPVGKNDNQLGGSASYASLAAAVLGKTHLVAIVGEDFPAKYRRLLERQGINLANLVTAKGETFRWSGFYEGTMNVAQTRSTCLNVFENFRPKLQPDVSQIPYVFLGNIDPELQLSVLDQLKNARFVACDTMNYWISSKREKLLEVIKRSHVVLLNSDEIRELTGETSLMKAAHEIIHLGPRYVVIKKGEHGATLAWRSGQTFIPSYPLHRLEDPTGAGDTFAGGLVGWVARQKRLSNRVMAESCVVGSALASFTCEGFGVLGLLRTNFNRLIDRCRLMRRMTILPPISLQS